MRNKKDVIMGIFDDVSDGFSDLDSMYQYAIIAGGSLLTLVCCVCCICKCRRSGEDRSAENRDPSLLELPTISPHDEEKRVRDLSQKFDTTQSQQIESKRLSTLIGLAEFGQHALNEDELNQAKRDLAILQGLLAGTLHIGEQELDSPRRLVPV